jgi:holliday junction DNA helicase RuvA
LKGSEEELDTETWIKQALKIMMNR